MTKEERRALVEYASAKLEEEFFKKPSASGDTRTTEPQSESAGRELPGQQTASEDLG